MSTKIYNAWHTDESLFMILKALKWLKANQRADYISNLQKVLKNEQKETVASLIKFFAGYIIKGYRALNPICSCVVYPHPRDGLVVQLFGIEKDCRKFVRRIKGRDYHYQNQCDKPRHISEKKWEERKKTWDTILSDEFTPSKNGFSFELISKTDALEMLFTEAAKVFPNSNGWGAESVGMFLASDFERGYERGSTHEFWQKRFANWLNYDMDELSLQSAQL